MTQKPLTLTAKVHRYPNAPWHIVVLPKEDSSRIGKHHTNTKGKWWYVPVEAKVGATSWKTSLWPKQKEGVYLLILTAAVRKKEAVIEGDTVRISMKIH